MRDCATGAPADPAVAARPHARSDVHPRAGHPTPARPLASPQINPRVPHTHILVVCRIEQLAHSVYLAHFFAQMHKAK
jgi:hypothetical protein